MGIFTNNITPSIPKDTNWNNVCYDILAREYLKRRGFQTAWDRTSGHFIDVDSSDTPPYSKKDIKKMFHNMKHLPKSWKESLDNTVQRIYSKYGVWVKWKIQMGSNGRIKSIYFVKFC